jgi:predicted O-methyltransferase YrrM
MVTTRTGTHDLGYFDSWPAPMYEAMTKLNPCPVINSTTPFYGPLIYTLCRVIPAYRALEMGVAQGWTSGFMAWAIKENNDRHGANGKYYGLDSAPKPEEQKAHDALGLPSEFIHCPEGSVAFLEKQTKWEKDSLDLVFIDGWHNTDYVRRELELVYPLVKDGGRGYILMHDVYATCEQVFREVSKDQRYHFEFVRFLENYGLAILRKMENYDDKKIYWPEGDQPHPEGLDMSVATKFKEGMKTAEKMK